MSIPELASQLIKKSLSEPKENSSSTIIIAGSKNVGKTSLINIFLEKNDNPRETLVLDYSFGRKSSNKPGIDKTICHVWEYGGKIDMLGDVLVSIPIQGYFFFCIMVDLCKVKKIWNTLETCIQAIQKNYVEPTAVPEIIIIGGQYDVFKNLDSEVKKVICCTLRSVAICLRAHLIFYSKKESNLGRRIKEIFHGMGFGNGVLLKEKNTNYLKPLVIPKGADNWENIGVTPSNLQEVKLRFAAKITSEPDITTTQSDNEIQRTHPEPILDSLAALKYEELRCMELFDPSLKDYFISLQ